MWGLVQERSGVQLALSTAGPDPLMHLQGSLPVVTGPAQRASSANATPAHVPGACSSRSPQLRVGRSWGAGGGTLENRTGSGRQGLQILEKCEPWAPASAGRASGGLQAGTGVQRVPGPGLSPTEHMLPFLPVCQGHCCRVGAWGLSAGSRGGHTGWGLQGALLA